MLSRLADRGEVTETSVRQGEHDRVPIFTLPGNPVSAYVSFQVFVRPAIGALQGYDGLGLETVRAEVTGPLRSPPGRRSFLRGVLDRPAGRVTPLTGQGSHQIATLGKANALIIVPGVGGADGRGRDRRRAGPAVSGGRADHGPFGRKVL